MKDLMRKIQSASHGARAGALAFAAVAVATAGATFARVTRPGPVAPPPVVIAPPPVPVDPPVTPPIGTPQAVGGVTVRGTLSQLKLARHGAGEVFYEIQIDTPKDAPVAARAATARRKPTDIILVLDRSGSMQAENRLPYAKAAIRELVSQLGPEDRFALVSFDDSARLEFNLAPMTPDARSQVLETVGRIETGGSTNISGGFEQARTLLGARNPSRSARVLLLSDGEANVGIVDAPGLSRIVRGFVEQGAVVSTIGMGLGFNQSLMSALADHGMGSYSYLESLESLGEILRKDLQDAQNLYASTSELVIRVGEGVSVRDSGGYPMEAVPGRPGEYRILTGQLLGGARKSLLIALGVPTDRLGEREVGRIAFSCVHGGATEAAKVVGESNRVSVVEAQAEAVASIRAEVYKKGWVANKLGALKAKFAGALARGDAKAAKEEIAAYQSAVRDAEGGSGIALAPAAAPEMKSMEKDLSEAFTGDAAVDSLNQNRLAKKQHLGARSLQRAQ